MPLMAFLLRPKALNTYAQTDSEPENSAEKHKEPSLTQDHPIFSFLKSPSVWMSFFFFLIVSIAFGDMQNFAPTVFMKLQNISALFGATLLSVFLLGGSMGMAFGSFMESRFKASERIIALALGFAAASLSLLTLGHFPWVLCLALVSMAGFATGLSGPARDMLIRQSAISNQQSANLEIKHWGGFMD
jgi:predicted MFS family arabinose efflux permease